MTVGPPRHGAPYPFARLDEAKRRAQAQGLRLIDFGVGEPRDDTPTFIREALVAGLTPASPYPRATGLPELTSVIAQWIETRFQAKIDPANVLPTLGSKEMIHSLPAYVLESGRDLVAMCSPAYPVYSRGAEFHGAQVTTLPLVAERGYLPDLASVAPAQWGRTALLWLNYPHNPTGAVAPPEFLAEAARLARIHGFVLACDEAYSEIWFDRPPPSALELDDLTNVLVLNTLSKRSCMAGYRSGFITGDPSLVQRIKAYRRSVGVTPPEFVQRASIAAWGDESHVVELRRLFATRRQIMTEALASAGLKTQEDATFFSWFATPDGMTSAAFAERLLQAGIVVTPGSAFGDEGEGYCRMALVPPTSECLEAADLVRSVLGGN